MINYKGVCSLLVLILIILFFAVLKKVYLKNIGEIESFSSWGGSPPSTPNYSYLQKLQQEATKTKEQIDAAINAMVKDKDEKIQLALDSAQSLHDSISKKPGESMSLVEADKVKELITKASKLPGNNPQEKQDKLSEAADEIAIVKTIISEDLAKADKAAAEEPEEPEPKNEVTKEQIETIINNNKQIKTEWQKRFRDMETELNDKYNRQSDILNTILHGKQDVERMIKKSKETITEQTDKFQDNVNKLGDFHDNYQKQLENVLKRKYDIQSDQFEVRKRIQQEKLNRLEKTVNQLNYLEKEITQTRDNKARSIRCLGDGERINIRPVESFGNPTGDYLVFLGDGNRDGCLAYSSPGRNGYGIEPCEVSNKRQHFKFVNVNNKDEYKRHLESVGLININEDDLDMSSGSFKLIHPKAYPDKCVTIDPNSNTLSVIPCHHSSRSKGGINQQYKTSNIHSTLKCSN